MAEPFIGQIMMFAGNFAPTKWAFCDGSLVSISDATSLFSIIGTKYGGNGVTNFGLPDLRSRVPIGMGQGPGLSRYYEGQMGGSERVALQQTEIPPHTHEIANTVNSDTSEFNVTGSATIKCDKAASSANTPEGNFLGKLTSRDTIYSGTGTENMNANAIELDLHTQGDVSVSVVSECHANAGGGSHSNLQPFTTMNFIISLDGLYPSRQ